MDDQYLGLDAFIRAIGVNRGIKHTFFLGAGASITSGLPSAEKCIWEWKREIFLTNNPTLQKQFAELSLESVKMKIQAWLDRKQDFPALNSEEEYSAYIQRCYPSVENRRRYFEEKIRLANPHIGYQLLCLMAEAELIDHVWTTNFDNLVARTAGNFKLTPIEIGIDTQNRLPNIPSKGEIFCISLHGDYRYDELKNTAEELQLQEKKLIDALIKQSVQAPVIVCGYSGRDKSIMDAFRTAYSEAGKGTLYWCGFGNTIPDGVAELIKLARSQNHEAYFVPTEGFDDLMTRLSLYCLSGDFRKRCEQIISSRKSGEVVPKRFSIPENLKTSGLVKSNAFLIDIPSEVLEFEIANWKANIWRWLDSVTANSQIVAVPYKHKILCFGNLDEIRSAFNGHISGEIIRTPIGDNDLRDDNSAVLSLLRKALVKSIAISHGLPTDDDAVLYEPKFDLRRENNVDCQVHKSVVFFLRKIGSKMFLVLKPSLYVTDTNGLEASAEVSKLIKIKILGYQHNREFSQELDTWRSRILSPKGNTIFEFPPNSGSHFKFTIQKLPIYAEIKEKTNSELPVEKWRTLIQHTGFVIAEPNLVFANRNNNAEVTDTHPLLGLVKNRPYDFSLNQIGLPMKINLGVISPESSATAVEKFLVSSQTMLHTGEKEADYLIDFPGFTQVFGIGLDIPKTGTAAWQYVPEVPASLTSKAGALMIAKNITAAIESLYASNKPNIVIVFIPDRWQSWRKFDTSDESFDLHDFIKAYCVQRGIATQFLEEETLSNPYKCRVWWWLAVALYSKSMRTPWVLDALDSNTAFVGLGFGLRHNAEKGRKIVLGCSHMYNSQGEGLRFRLSTIQNPIWVRRNPYMSREDARQVGETIRTLFYESKSRLPDRVVIHKLTPFKQEERDGLLDGLSGVSEIDMIEINVENALRYLASRYNYREKNFVIEGYPIKRGTVVPTDDYSALLWAHGSTSAVQPGRTYFQGKRRIPAPLLIRRYAGNSDLSLIANEILGLSKMDWNSADLYSKLPVTVFSSQRIARIGTLLQRFDPASYDYRLFI